MFARFRRRKNNSEDPENDESDANRENNSGENNSSEDGQSKEEQDGLVRGKFVNVRYRQWLHDRIEGIPAPVAGRYEKPEPYPPSLICLPPCIIRCCPYLLEENCLFTLVGRIGCCSDDPWARSAIMRYGLALNFVCLCLGIYVCLAITDNKLELLQVTSLARAELTPTPDDFYDSAIMLDVGLSAMAVDNPNTGVQQIIRFDQLCDLVGDGIDKFLKEPAEESCKSCEDIRLQLVMSMLVSVAMILPSMLLQCSRMYVTADVNCHKVAAIFTEAMSLAGFVLTYVQFRLNCLEDAFQDGVVAFDRNGEIVAIDAIAEAGRVDYDWSVGYGMICLFAALALKSIVFLCNCFLQTPDITRNTYEQKVYEGKVKRILDGTDDSEEVAGDRDNSFSDGLDDDSSSSSESS